MATGVSAAPLPSQPCMTANWCPEIAALIQTEYYRQPKSEDILQNPRRSTRCRHLLNTTIQLSRVPGISLLSTGLKTSTQNHSKRKNMSDILYSYYTQCKKKKKNHQKWKKCKIFFKVLWKCLVDRPKINGNEKAIQVWWKYIRQRLTVTLLNASVL